MPIGKRLREERERLGLSQPAFAAVAGTTKQTLFSWETGKTAPDGFQLAALAASGADVLYILTGVRSPLAQSIGELTPRQRALLNNYEAADETGKRYIERAADLEAQSVSKKAARGGE